MPSAPKITLRLNTEKLRKDMRAFALRSSKLPHQIVNRAVMSIAMTAAREMPVVPQERIDKELAATFTPGKLKSGKLSKAKKRAREILSSVGLGDSRTPGVPLAVLIIRARARPGSNFNALTGGRYAISNPGRFRTGSRKGNQDAMLETISRMIKARHSSTGYFRTCAKAIMFLFKGTFGPLPPPVQGGGRTSGRGSISGRIGKIAGGTPATGENARARFWVSGTEADKKNGLFKVAERVWQAAIDYEGKFLMKKAMEIEYRKVSRLFGFRI